MVIIIDNYDSFTFNLFQFIGMLTDEVKVYRNDQITVEAIEALQPSHIILSPGPGFPENAGICETVLEKLQGKMPILGVCLGHQAIGEVFGGKIVHARELVHGKHVAGVPALDARVQGNEAGRNVRHVIDGVLRVDLAVMDALDL